MGVEAGERRVAGGEQATAAWTAPEPVDERVLPRLVLPDHRRRSCRPGVVAVSRARRPTTTGQEPENGTLARFSGDSGPDHVKSVTEAFTQTERAFQAQVVKYARLMGWTAYHTHDSRRSQAGFPDLVLVRR